MKSVVIFSTPRSGSTVSCNLVKNIYEMPSSVKVFIEPWKHYQTESQNKEKIMELSDSIGKESFILKLHHYHLFKYPIEIVDFISSVNTVKVKISRSEKFDQLVSFYISLARNKFFFKKGEEFKSEVVPINDSLLEQSIKLLQMFNLSLEQSKLIFDRELVYERDILNKDIETNFTSSIIPLNYLEIKNYIWSKYGNY